MTHEERTELERFIGINIFKIKPRIEAWAANADETAGCLFENHAITKETIRGFCKDHPKYHYAERELFPCYATDANASRALEEKIIELVGQIELSKLGECWFVESDSRKIRTFSRESLGVALGLFARQLF